MCPRSPLPLSFTLIAGGRSNLTFRVEDAEGRAWVLRRPPVHHVLPTAHDMVREHRLMSSLAPSGIPVPKTIGLCTDETVNDRPFFVMEFVEGHIVRDAPEAEQAFDLATRGGVGDHMAETLSALHAHRPRVGGAGRPGTARGLHRASAQAVERGNSPKCGWTASITAGWSSGSATNWRAGSRHSSAHRSCTATTAWTTSSSTTRRGAGHPRLGAVHAGRSPGRPRPADGLLDRRRRRYVRARSFADHRARASPPARR